ncbi:helix-turn-helix domain-containing protein [Listeria aquatica]|uniref:helix-turn-helix domain-containing protein n=1 Tax=Listeria aquatica TaxID=1494960 RepID=UPI003EF627E5
MFANTLKELRKKENLTQGQLSMKLGISRDTLANYEIGRREPDFETLKKIAKYFGVSTDYLLGNDEMNESDVVAAHMDDDLTDEQKEEIYRYIEAIKIRDKNNEK